MTKDFAERAKPATSDVTESKKESGSKTRAARRGPRSPAPAPLAVNIDDIPF